MEWISAKDRLPALYQYVLMCNIANNRVRVVSLQRGKDGLYWSTGEGWWTEFENLTHWMPLPEPPKKEE